MAHYIDTNGSLTRSWDWG